MSIAVSCFINCVSSLSTEIGEASYEAPYKSNYHDGNSKDGEDSNDPKQV